MVAPFNIKMIDAFNGTFTIVNNDELARQAQTYLVQQLALVEPDQEIKLDVEGFVVPPLILDACFRPFFMEIKHRVSHLAIVQSTNTFGTEDGCAALSIYDDIFHDGSALRYLTISKVALGPGGFDAVRRLVTKPSLEELDMRDAGLEQSAAVALAQSKVSNHGTLTGLFLSRNNNISGADENFEGARAIAGIIKLSANLVKFAYGSTRINVEGSIPILEALARSNLSLELLDLAEFELGYTQEQKERCLNLLLELLSHCSTATTINLAFVRLGSTMAAQVIGAIQSSSALLQDLGLAETRLCRGGMAGLFALLAFLATQQASHLHTLNLDGNELGDTGTSLLIRAMAALDSSLSLRKLSLGENAIEQAGIQTLIEHRASFRNLETLDLDNNDDIPRQLAIELIQVYNGVDVVLHPDDLNDNGSDDEEDNGSNQDEEGILYEQENSSSEEEVVGGNGSVPVVPNPPGEEPAVAAFVEADLPIAQRRTPRRAAQRRSYAQSAIRLP